MCQVASAFDSVCVFGGKDVVQLRFLGWRQHASLAKTFVHQLFEDSALVDHVVKMLEAMAELVDLSQRAKERLPTAARTTDKT